MATAGRVWEGGWLKKIAQKTLVRIRRHGTRARGAGIQTSLGWYNNRTR